MKNSQLFPILHKVPILSLETSSLSLLAQPAHVLHPSCQTLSPTPSLLARHTHRSLPVHSWILVLARLDPASVLTFKAYSLPASNPSNRNVEAFGRMDAFLTSVWESLW